MKINNKKKILFEILLKEKKKCFKTVTVHKDTVLIFQNRSKP